MPLLAKPQYQCGKLPVDIRGVESVYDGEVLPYFSAALASNSVRATLDVAPALEREGLGSVVAGKECTS